MLRKHRINATSVTSKILIEQKKTLEVDVLNFTERTRPFPLFFFSFFKIRILLGYARVKNKFKTTPLTSRAFPCSYEKGKGKVKRKKVEVSVL